MTVARPFLKWAGGKTQLLPELLKRVPQKFGTYYEPFLGGGALFFALQPKRAMLGDLNDRLCRTYGAIRESVDEVIERLKKHAKLHSEQHYYATRATKCDAFSESALAAWMIYLNKTCFNGLYRVNKSGGFNVPIGSYKNPVICDEENLRACSAALKEVVIRHQDFRSVPAKAGDFVYFDSPYAPVSESADFVSYTATGFVVQDQINLRDLAWELKRRGVYVMLTNSVCGLVEDLYGDQFALEKVAARRSINSKKSGRGPVGEYIIR